MKVRMLPQAVKKLRRFSWAEDEGYLVRCVLRTAVKGRFSQVPLLASLTAALARYHPSFAVALPDALLEEVRAGLEEPEAASYQRRISHMRLLGELYSYRILDSRSAPAPCIKVTIIYCQGSDTGLQSWGLSLNKEGIDGHP